MPPSAPVPPHATSTPSGLHERTLPEEEGNLSSEEDEQEAFEDGHENFEGAGDTGFVASGIQKSLTFTNAGAIPTTKPVAKASTTSSFGRTSIDSVGRSLSSRENKLEISQAEQSAPLLKAELNSLSETSAWWTRDAIPDSLEPKLGNDLIFEVDTHEIQKRSNKLVIYKDYYFLFHDLSQIVLEMQFLAVDPRTSVIVNSLSVNPAPQYRKDLLHKLTAVYSDDVVDVSTKLVGAKVASGIVGNVFSHVQKKHPQLLMPIGEKSYGVTVYRNVNHHVTMTDEVKPGDILCMKNAKFATKALGGLGNKHVTIGEGNSVYSAVITEYDPKKDKFKVLECDKSGVVKKESYKLGDMKSGRVRVFRLVDRGFIGW